MSDPLPQEKHESGINRVHAYARAGDTSILSQRRIVRGLLLFLLISPSVCLILSISSYVGFCVRWGNSYYWLVLRAGILSICGGSYGGFKPGVVWESGLSPGWTWNQFLAINQGGDFFFELSIWWLPLICLVAMVVLILRWRSGARG